MEKKDRIKKDISRESYLQTVIRRFKQHHLGNGQPCDFSGFGGGSAFGTDHRTV